MTITPYSIVMSVLWFSLACLIGSIILPKISKGGLFLIAVIFILAFIRLCIPLDFFKSIIVRSYFIYSFLQKIVQKPALYQFTFGQCLLVLWIAGALIRLFWLASKLISQHEFRRNSYALGSADDFMTLAQQVSKELGYHGTVKLAISPNATTAYQTGLFRPYILLPGNIEDFSLTDIRNMLYHELCHFLGFDLWILLAIQIVTCALWWNPVMYLLNRSVEQLLELRCDQRVCGHLGKSEQYDYMQTLINLARINSPRLSNVVLGYTGDSEANITQRFQLMTQTRTTPVERMRLYVGLIACILLFISSYCFILQPNTGPPTEEVAGDSIGICIIDAFIIRSSDGEATLYLDGVAARALTEEDLQKEPYCNYEIFDVNKEASQCSD